MALLPLEPPGPSVAVQQKCFPRAPCVDSAWVVVEQRGDDRFVSAEATGTRPRATRAAGSAMTTVTARDSQAASPRASGWKSNMAGAASRWSWGGRFPNRRVCSRCRGSRRFSLARLVGCVDATADRRVTPLEPAGASLRADGCRGAGAHRAGAPLLRGRIPRSRRRRRVRWSRRGSVRPAEHLLLDRGHHHLQLTDLCRELFVELIGHGLPCGTRQAAVVSQNVTKTSQNIIKRQ